MKSGRKLIAAAAGAAMVTACAPAAAHAAITASVTGDAGQPVALSPGAVLPIRNMDVRGYVNVGTSDGAYYSWKVTGPDGVDATSSLCWRTQSTPSNDRLVTYRGNGTYTLTVSTFSDSACAKPVKSAAFQWSTGAGVALGQPTSALMIRAPFSFSTNTHSFQFQGTPGAVIYEIKYGKGLTLNPDGTFASVPKDAYLNRTTGLVEISEREPGDYTMVARAKNGDFYTPWSAPVTFRLMAPFDLASTRFPDSRGPSYKLRGEVRERAAAGSRVTVSIAKGKRGKKFRRIGRPKINSKGVFTVRFTQRKRGNYRLRYSFKGNKSVAKGTVYESIRIRRVLG